MSTAENRSLTLARWLLGFIYLINGLNWVWKLLPYPSMYDPHMPQTPAVIQALIDTGFMFAVVRALEFVTGIALIANVWTPLTLVAIFPITVVIWMVDVIILGGALRAQVMGWSVLVLNVALMLAFVDVYRPLLQRRAVPTHVRARGGFVVLLTVLANLVGLIAVGWLLVMVVNRWRGA